MDRAESLRALARLWMTVRLFHPAATADPSGWDADTTAAAARAISDDEPLGRIAEALLATLGDPATRVCSARDAAAPPLLYDLPPAKERSLRHIGTVGVLSAVDFRDASDVSLAGAVERDLTAALEEAAQCYGLVVDLRFADQLVDSYVGRWLSPLLPRSVSGPAVRCRQHAGWSGDGPPGGAFWSGQVTQDPPTFPGTDGPAARVPLVVLLGSGTPVSQAWALAAQAAGRALVVADGPLAVPAHRIEPLDDDLVAVIRTAEYVVADDSAAAADVVLDTTGESHGTDISESVAVKQCIALLSSPPEERKAATTARRLATPAPDRLELSDRVFALMKLWAVIDRFFPHVALCDVPWDDTLGMHLDDFLRATDAESYAIAVMRMASRIQDSHTMVGSSAMAALLGTHAPAILVREIEGQTVVVESGERDVAVGDVVVALDGRPVHERVSWLSELTSASTPGALSRNVHMMLLLGAADSTLTLTLTRDERARDVTLVHRERMRMPARTTPVLAELEPGIAYVDLDRVSQDQCEEAVELVRKSQAAVLDLRGYPRSLAALAISDLSPRDCPAARLRLRELRGLADRDELGSPVELVWDNCQSVRAGKAPWHGRAIVLIDEHAQSASEHACLFFEAAFDAVFVGSPTAGANGNSATVRLPGSTVVTFTGHDVTHGDGRRLQRVGIVPHVEVRPTIAGIRAGHDEVLEAGLSLVSRSRTSP